MLGGVEKAVPPSKPQTRKRACRRDDSGERRDKKSVRIVGRHARYSISARYRSQATFRRTAANGKCVVSAGCRGGCRDRDHRLSWTASVQLCQVRWPWPPQALADGHICLSAAPDDAGHMVFRTEDGTVLLELCLGETCQILNGISPE